MAEEIEKWMWVESPETGPLGKRPPIHHIAISVADLEASVAWYREKLGFSEYWRMTTPALVMMRLGETFIELMHKAGSAPSNRAFGTIFDSTAIQGYAHVSFEVGDAYAALEALLARGVNAYKHPKDPVALLGGKNGLAPGVRICFFYDLDGNLFQVWSGQASAGHVK